MLKKKKREEDTPTIENSENTESQKEEKKKKKISKRKVAFNSYVGLLVIASIAFGAHLVYNFYIHPRSVAGSPIFGNRLDYLEEIPENIVPTVEAFGREQGRVEDVNITIIGGIVYFDVRVEDGTGVEVARAVAEEIADVFVEEAGDKAKSFNLQLVVSSGDISELKADNRADALDHVRLNQIKIVETLTEFAEIFPTIDENVGRGNGTINRVLNNIALLRNRAAYTEKVGELYEMYDAALAEFEARVNALTPLTAEEIEILIEQEDTNVLSANIEDIRDIPQSNINDFPSWGALNNETGSFEWN